MAIKIAINGYGRIGRCILRALYESNLDKEIEIVAINDTGGDIFIHKHLTQYDSVHGKLNLNIDSDNENIIINDHKIRVFSERNPELLPWGELGIDVVCECTGIFTSKAKSSAHLKAGAKKVLISAPGGEDIDATVVYGVNHNIITKDMTVISNASCTTNCLAPVAKVINDTIGIESGLMTTIHSYTNDQVLTDSYHSDIRRGRSAAMSMIPTKTGAAKSVGLVLPELLGKLDGLSIRVPTPNVSLVDFTFTAKRETSKEEIHNSIIAASLGYLKGILAVNDKPFVSIDFNHDKHSSIFDLSQTKVSGNLVKIFSWYDNEWGFSNRMLDVILKLA